MYGLLKKGVSLVQGQSTFWDIYMVPGTVPAVPGTSSDMHLHKVPRTYYKKYSIKSPANKRQHQAKLTVLKRAMQDKNIRGFIVFSN